ncbi:RluA family pseudouridine synthase [Thalassotalea castellviae]|uniref:Pseudouridine synthase n=1 Tax=Thalassotalea castellviae TaxID=3075612 RepID=A0ABU3A545_9GAMM|nr:pseudouridine synthase [Thalassotalea sp. W431]MDT0605084.1 pseudouridine synthase [Thalassotalea sp. W431]
MLSGESCFTPFKESIADHCLPQRFTYPFYYQPHPLALVAVKELQQYLTNQCQWHHNFGIPSHQLTTPSAIPEEVSGKMFGVLVVKNSHGELGYLSAFSGKLANQSCLAKFVPPVFDIQQEDNFFIEKQSVINNINQQISRLEQNPAIEQLSCQLIEQNSQFESELQAHREKMITNRQARKHKRLIAEQAYNDGDLNAQEYKAHSIQMSRESVEDKHALADLKQHWQEKIAAIESTLKPLEAALADLKKQRKKLSNALQKYLFKQYQFLNQSGEAQNLITLFKDSLFQTPPAGAGDCAAPKLLQYAFRHHLTPITMAEFWWGAAPKSEIRQHKNFYPACQGKCQPILTHMLAGMALDENPLLTNPAAGKPLPIVYHDQDIVVVNKPAEFLSVPGKSIADSVYSRIKEKFPQATGSLIVHRLDMATSGLLILALNPRAHKKLQQQFINKTIEKRYVAIIEGELTTETGSIDLPLTVDINDRPRQLVCFTHGKKALTRFEKYHPQPTFTSDKKLTKVYLYPKTGRTHQLRMHCAHFDGLNMPILGDDLYGKKANRLHLHAEYLAFEHPVTKKTMAFQQDAEF